MSSKKKSNILPFPTLASNVAFMNICGKLDHLSKENKTLINMSIQTLLNALKSKDEYTYGHSLRVAFYASSIGKELALSNEELFHLELSGLLHDIGKIGVPDHILKKPERLDDDEFLEMKKHPVESANIIEGFPFFSEAVKGAKYHHERYDGRGYPEGLKGDDIPFNARAILIADTFDAMTSDRPYRKGLSYDIAFQELRDFSGSQFDGKLVEAFINAMTKEEQKNSETFSLNILKGHFKKAA